MAQDNEYLTRLKEENFEEAKKLLSDNGYEIGEYNPHNMSVWLIENDHTRCLAIGCHEQEAIDYAVDNGNWDSLKMSAADLAEYEQNEWHDSFIRAGNASEAFWAENTSMTKILTA
ncbi:hypothetical protein OTK49_20820 [Vibrio coralliirubri]|uniref:hypothetical protein n=1 Tax=Vibrio coralliirubri TaxID=1516159 RepID=UPI002284EAF9|nr:hypothetical protein [Vibrio coralliirubri]MCY9864962.1 hypothetical protein [Vibrio coralliirubri]